MSYFRPKVLWPRFIQAAALQVFLTSCYFTKNSKLEFVWPPG